MSLFRSQTREEISLIFDIGNGSVAASLIKFTEHNIPLVLYTHREPLTFLPEPDAKHLQHTMLKLLRVLGKHVHKHGLAALHHSWLSGPTIKHIHCFYSSPWFISHTKALTLSQPSTFVVTNSVIDTLIAQEKKEFLATIQQGYYEQLFGNDIRLLEKNIIHTKLNGYEIREPIGKKARDVEVTFYLSFISETILSEVERVIHDSFGHHKIEHHSSALGSWAAIRAMFPAASDFLSLDISGETTDISFTNRGVLTETISIPVGRSTLIRHLVQSLAVPPEVALSFLIMHSHKAVEESFAQKINTAVIEAMKDWQQQLLTALKQLQKQYLVPKQIFVSAEMDLAPLFIDALKLPVPIDFSLPNNTFEVSTIGSEKVKPFIVPDHNVKIDPVLSLESIFVHSLTSGR